MGVPGVFLEEEERSREGEEGGTLASTPCGKLGPAPGVLRHGGEGARVEAGREEAPLWVQARGLSGGIKTPGGDGTCQRCARSAGTRGGSAGTRGGSASPGQGDSRPASGAKSLFSHGARWGNRPVGEVADPGVLRNIVKSSAWAPVEGSGTSVWSV